MPSDTLRLTVKTGPFQALCDELAGKIANPAQLLAALSSLQTFIGAHTEPGEAAGEAYPRVRAILEEALEAARARVLAQQGAEIREAVEAGNAQALSQVYRSLSRNGFQQAAQQGYAAASPTQWRQGADWVRDWYTDAHQRASAASPYPDALDFDKAGIVREQYLAVQDLRIFFIAQGQIVPDQA